MHYFSHNLHYYNTSLPSLAQQLDLLRVCVHGVCVFTAVYVQFGWVNCRAQFRVWVTILGHMSLHFHFTSLVPGLMKARLPKTKCVVIG